MASKDATPKADGVKAIVRLRLLIDNGFCAAVSPTATSVYLVLLVKYGNREGKAWPGVPRLTADTGMSERGVKRALAELRRHGLIDVLKHGGMRVASVYRVNTPPQLGPRVAQDAIELGPKSHLTGATGGTPTPLEEEKKESEAEQTPSVVVDSGVSEADPEPEMSVLMRRLNAVGYADPIMRATLATDHPVEVAHALDALDVAVAGGKIGNPAGYLDGILKKTLGGNGRPRDDTEPMSAAERDRRREEGKAALLKLKAERASR